MIVWSRHVHAPADAPFCAVLDVGASVVTACRGRWEPHERDDIRWDVPEDERCGGCVLAMLADEPDADDASDPTWVGEGPRRARERLSRKGAR